MPRHLNLFTAAVAAAAVLLPAAPAFATAAAEVYVVAYPTRWEVCASGHTRTLSATDAARPAQWVLQIRGSRSDGSPIDYTITADGETFTLPACLEVPRGAAGAFVATLRFVNAGHPDLYGAAASYAVWAAGQQFSGGFNLP